MGKFHQIWQKPKYNLDSRRLQIPNSSACAQALCICSLSPVLGGEGWGEGPFLRATQLDAFALSPLTPTLSPEYGGEGDGETPRSTARSALEVSHWRNPSTISHSLHRAGHPAHFRVHRSRSLQPRSPPAWRHSRTDGNKDRPADSATCKTADANPQ